MSILNESVLREMAASDARVSERNIFDSLAPLDYRYWDHDVAEILSENAFTRYKLRVELALVSAQCNLGHCDLNTVTLVRNIIAGGKPSTEDVYALEKVLQHDIRALVEALRALLPDSVKPLIHRGATSYDIVDTANAMRFRDVTQNVLVPSLKKLVYVLIGIASREAETIQIGRTHGQHAVPITFGYTIAGYISRLGQCIERLVHLSGELPGKFSGAVGAYNASALLYEDPIQFEADLLFSLGLVRAEHSTQIVPSEPMIRLLSEAMLAAGIMADLADDMRHLQRTEIGEVGEEFEKDQVGSSTMPQKRNPINFENVKGMWKIVLPRLMTVYSDQLSEHQRDLTNSVTSRTYGEIICYIVAMAKRMSRTMKKLIVDKDNLRRNLDMSKGAVLAEPLYIILASLGHPNAHEKVRQLTLEAQRTELPFYRIIENDAEVRDVYKPKMTSVQCEILCHPSNYIGLSAIQAEKIAENWHERLTMKD